MLADLQTIASTLPRSAWVSSAGLGDNGVGDRVHFDAASQREMGRYFSKFWEAEQGVPSPTVDLKVYGGHFFNVGDSISTATIQTAVATATSVCKAP